MSALVGAFVAGILACVGGVTILNSAQLVGSEAATYAWLLILAGLGAVAWATAKWWASRKSA